MITHKISHIGKNRPLIFVVTSNGAKIANNMHQAFMVFKVVDESAIDPMIGKSTKPQS